VIVVADASPIHYLVLIEVVDVLQPLYTHVVVPESVAQELKQTAAPEGIQRWIVAPPDWCEVRPDPPSDPALEKFLDRGERAAISLAALLPADRVLIDEWEGRNEAARRKLRVTGTLGVLAEAHQHNLLDFEAAFARLEQTNFYMSVELVNHMRRRLRGEK
jgi:predicted nucleic acid-binding protein